MRHENRPNISDTTVLVPLAALKVDGKIRKIVVCLDNQDEKLFALLSEPLWEVDETASEGSFVESLIEKHRFISVPQQEKALLYGERMVGIPKIVLP